VEWGTVGVVLMGFLWVVGKLFGVSSWGALLGGERRLGKSGDKKVDKKEEMKKKQ
jgi:hypothetical protein